MATLGIGAVVSFIVALVAVKFFISYLQKHGFKAFGWYRIALGALMLALIFAKVI
jgi:undecaprenyl-diphosphatase